MSRLKKIIAKKMYSILPLPYVLMFHHIIDAPAIPRSACTLDFQKFKDFVLEFKGCYTTMIDIAQNKRKGKIAITFDDGLEDLYTVAYKFLKENEIPFTAFIVTDFLDTEGYITTEQLREMSADPLVTIGSHGVSHKVFPKMTSLEKKIELEESQRKLQEIIGKDVKIFAYSHGQYDDETLSIMGCYDYAVAAGASLSMYFTWNKHLIPRYNIETDTYIRQLEFFKNAALDRTDRKNY